MVCLQVRRVQHEWRRNYRPKRYRVENISISLEAAGEQISGRAARVLVVVVLCDLCPFFLSCISCNIWQAVHISGRPFSRFYSVFWFVVFRSFQLKRTRDP